MIFFSLSRLSLSLSLCLSLCASLSFPLSPSLALYLSLSLSLFTFPILLLSSFHLSTRGPKTACHRIWNFKIFMYTQPGRAVAYVANTASSLRVSYRMYY